MRARCTRSPVAWVRLLAGTVIPDPFVSGHDGGGGDEPHPLDGYGLEGESGHERERKIRVFVAAGIPVT